MFRLANGSVLHSACWLTSWQGFAAFCMRKEVLQSLPLELTFIHQRILSSQQSGKANGTSSLYSSYILQTCSSLDLRLYSCLYSVLKIEHAFRVIWTRIMHFLFFTLFFCLDPKPNKKTKCFEFVPNFSQMYRRSCFLLYDFLQDHLGT